MSINLIALSKRVFLPVVLLFVMAFAVLGPASANDGISIEKPFARASVTAAAKAGAAYFTIVNHGPADRLIAASAAVAKKTMLHESKVVDGVTKMIHQEAIAVPMHGSVQLAPGGLHVMLMGLEQPLEEGGMFPLTLEFENAGTIEVMVHVGGVAADGAAMDHGDHSNHGTTD